MKRFSILLVFFFCLSMQLEAQELNFGVKAGYNRTNLFSSFEREAKARNTFHLGVFAELPMKGILSFHPELIYSRQGQRIPLRGFITINDPFLENDVPEYAELYNDYLQLPLLLRLNVSEVFSFEVGPQVGFTVSKGTRFDFGPAAGIGFDIKKKFKLQLRYYVGLSDLVRNNTFENRYDSVIQLSVGYVIF